MTVKEEMIKELENMIKIIEKEVPDDCELIVLRPFAYEGAVGFFNKDFIERRENNKLSVEVINDTTNNIKDYYTYADEDCYDLNLIHENKETKMSVIDFL